MDQSSLVKNGHKLVQLLTAAGMNPRAAMWVHNPEADIWRLWIVPAKGLNDKREFYRRVAEVITNNRADLPGLDVSDTEFVKETHPAIQALSKLMRVETGGTIQMTDSTFNGYHLPNCIVLQMTF